MLPPLLFSDHRPMLFTSAQQGMHELDAVLQWTVLGGPLPLKGTLPRWAGVQEYAPGEPASLVGAEAPDPNSLCVGTGARGGAFAGLLALKSLRFSSNSLSFSG